MYFFFRLPERKRYQKERAPSALPGLLQTTFSLKDRNSLRSNSLSFFTPEIRPPLHAPTVRPDSHADYVRRYLKFRHIQIFLSMRSSGLIGGA